MAVGVIAFARVQNVCRQVPGEYGRRRRSARTRDLEDEIAEPPWSQEGRIDRLATVRGGDDKDVPPRLESVELGHETREHLIVDARGGVAAGGANRVDFVEEHHDRGGRLVFAGLAGYAKLL